MGGAGYPQIDLSESVPPASDRERWQAPASCDGRDDVLGSTLKAANDPLTDIAFGWGFERSAAVFAGGVGHDGLVSPK